MIKNMEDSENKDEAERAHVLIVDDEQGIRAPLMGQLSSKGYEVSEAETADQAMAVIVANKIDLIITDIKMPGASGFDLLSLSKMYEERIPIILMSGHVDENTMKNIGIEEGAISVLEKPFSIDNLFEKVDRALETSSFES